MLRQREAEHFEDEAANKRKNEEQLHYYSELTRLGVDLTKYLCVQSQKVDKTIRIETGGSVNGNFMAMGDVGAAGGVDNHQRIPNITLNMDAHSD